MHKILNKIGSKYCHLLPILLSFLFITCNEEHNTQKDEKINQFPHIKDVKNNKDSLKITIDIIGKGKFGVSLPDAVFYNYALDFSNEGDSTKTITQNILKVSESMVIAYNASIHDKGKITDLSQYYLVVDTTSVLDLEHNALTHTFKKNKLSVNSLYQDYNALNTKIFKAKDKISLIPTLDALHRKHKLLYTNEKSEAKNQLNDIQYFKTLQRIDPLNQKVDYFIKTLKNPVSCNPLQQLVFKYVTHRIAIFDFESLNSNNYPEEYIDLLSKGMFSFLRFEDNKGNNKYLKAKSWLRSTDFYSEHSYEIEKELTPLDNKQFKKLLAQLNISDTTDRVLSFPQLIQENPSPYYLIDFWATWCAPCIGGVKIMNEMDMPKNINVISISMDKERDKEKWKTKTVGLKQSITYWLDDTNENAISFLKFIELQSIPRYIIIDKNMNLIDQAFYRPEQSQFLPKLKNIRNHKYW